MAFFQCAELRNPSLRLQPPFGESVLPGDLRRKTSFTQDPDRCFLASLGYNGEFHLARLEIEHCVCGIPLREDCLLLGKRRLSYPRRSWQGNSWGRNHVFFLADATKAIVGSPSLRSSRTSAGDSLELFMKNEGKRTGMRGMKPSCEALRFH